MAMQRGGFPRGGANMNQMIRQAQKMQQDMLKKQEELSAREYEASAGGGAVKVVCTGGKEFKSIEISPDAVDPDDVEMLQDLVLAAVNEALRTADESTAAEMGKLTGGMNLGF
jgi:DNA-binding YbaB/EbfC family protein